MSEVNPLWYKDCSGKSQDSHRLTTGIISQILPNIEEGEPLHMKPRRKKKQHLDVRHCDLRYKIDM